MTKLTIISDTHLKHKQLPALPGGDILIHCGDATNMGTEVEIAMFLGWLSLQQEQAGGKYKHVIYVAGNHDFWFEKHPVTGRDLIPANVIYLENDGCEVMGLKIWGSPVTPYFCAWAFNVERGPDIREYWDMIPDDTDVLITHGPPHDILDKIWGVVDVATGKLNPPLGCEDLRDRLNELPNLRLHCFGHIHSGYGTKMVGNTQFVNAAICGENYKVVNKPIEVEL